MVQVAQQPEIKEVDMKALAKALVTGATVIAIALVCIDCGAPGGSAGAAPASASTPAAVPSAAAVSTATALPSATAGPSATVLPTSSASSAPTASSMTDISSLRQGIYVACDANDVNKNCITREPIGSAEVRACGR